MGKPIVYCQGCGKSLREEEFDRGHAHMADNRPYCVACKPIEKPAASPETPSKRPAAPPLIRPGSSTRVAVPAIPPAPRQSRSALYIGGGLAAAALLLLIVLLASGGNPPEPPDPPRVDPARTGTPATKPVPGSEPEALLALERLAASSTDPDAILAQCRKTRQAVTASRWESRIRKAEDRATELRMERDKRSAQQLDPFLAQIRKIIEGDSQCSRRDEVERMLEVAKRISGPREAEVVQIRTDYRKKCDEVPRRAAEEAQAQARLLAAQKKFEEALARLDAYLTEFRSSPQAPAVEKLRGEIDAEFRIEASLVRVAGNGSFLLSADRAVLTGAKLQLKGSGKDTYLGNWHTTEEGASWTLEVGRPGKYRAELDYACAKDAGGEALVTAGPLELRKKIEPTGDWKKYTTVTLGSLTLPAGRVVLSARGISVKGGGLMNLKTLKLIPE